MFTHQAMEERSAQTRTDLAQSVNTFVRCAFVCLFQEHFSMLYQLQHYPSNLTPFLKVR